MTEETRLFLESTYHHWITLRDAQYMKGLNAREREGMIRAMQFFQAGYTTDLWCPDCVAEMVRSLYTKFDQWKAEQAAKLPVVCEIRETLPNEPTVENVHETFPVNEKPAVKKKWNKKPN